ncbi:glutamate--cysteine ligase [Reichenbachiella sp. 5M10]|uniref:glutamate-cysteine ligase family protein n=1 Tax=Reichenbachiella sp. 5M10 TaxID=1889772 RepID=UPI000C1454FF|nr:glutamate-cysteine ligase family protein [Reichenbachiella sp. 5M10]PIB36254.1 glutamate--cysteine ligase [Reichenbachiella sp. 5M10]
MKAHSKRLHLYQAYGIELEYMIVDRDTLAVKPIADQLLADAAGKQTDTYTHGMVTWSNELVLHVIELKCTEPVSDLVALNRAFHENILLINHLLEKYNARLLGSAAHPWMNPETDTYLWPHGNADIYQTYDRIFGCKGHGWSNLQSTHLNLPFYDDEEFAPLHAAARVLLPLLPALSASSPILDGHFTGYQDKRMSYYKMNQHRIPSITGKVIPERAFSKREYGKLIYEKIAEDLVAYDTERLLDPVWVNSRGIIARFDRGSIEIRILDIQENPGADLAIIALIIHVLKLMTDGKLAPLHDLMAWEKEPLYDLLNEVIKKGQDTLIKDEAYLRMFGCTQSSLPITALWQLLIDQVQAVYPTEIAPWLPTLDKIMSQGTLSKRILSMVDGEYSQDNLRLLCRELSENLEENKMLSVCETV